MIRAKDLQGEQVERGYAWAENLAHRVLEKEFRHVPDAVAFMACVYFIRGLSKQRPDILCKEYIIKIIDNCLEETNNVLAKA